MYQLYLDPQPIVQALIDSGAGMDEFAALCTRDDMQSICTEVGVRFMTTFHEDRRALSFEDSFDGEVTSDYSGNRRLGHSSYGKDCQHASSTACPSAHMISSGGFPFSMDAEPSSSERRQQYASKQKKKQESTFPCDVSIGYPIACKGSISCSTPDVPLCGGACGGLVTGSVSGGGEWDCSADFSSCTGKLFISGGVKVGIPNCKWCPSALEFT
eukprot:scaffold141267_cov127-Phaeocystis_antarctica.AAC.1